MESNQELNDLYQNSNNVFYFFTKMKKERKDVEGGRCTRGRDEQLGFIEKMRQKFGRNT